MKIDIFSMTQDGKRTLSYMSQTIGLMADLDLGTEHLRFMGSRWAHPAIYLRALPTLMMLSRFVIGYLQGSER